MVEDSYGDLFHPVQGGSITGARVFSRGTGTFIHTCTAGFGVVDAAGRVGFVTAGHCYHDDAPGDQITQYVPKGSTEPVDGVHLTPLRMVDDTGDKPGYGGVLSDSSVTFLKRNTNSIKPSKINSDIHVVGVMSVAGARDELIPGTAVCEATAQSGIICGHVIEASRSMLQVDFETMHGDSGSPVFVVDESGNALAVGIVKGNQEELGTGAVTYLAPALERMNLRLVTSRPTGCDQPQPAEGCAVLRLA